MSDEEHHDRRTSRGPVLYKGPRGGFRVYNSCILKLSEGNGRTWPYDRFSDTSGYTDGFCGFEHLRERTREDDAKIRVVTTKK